MEFTDRDDVIDYLVVESDGEYTREELEGLDGYDLVDKFLTWEGILGYTDMIISAVNVCNA